MKAILAHLARMIVRPILAGAALAGIAPAVHAQSGIFSRIQHVFAEHDLDDHVVFIGSGKLGFPDAAVLGFTLGCDLISVGREALMSIGCIQALRCHTNHCPTGIATQHPWLIRGLDPGLKSERLASYIVSLREELRFSRTPAGRITRRSCRPSSSRFSMTASDRRPWPRSSTGAAGGWRQPRIPRTEMG